MRIDALGENGGRAGEVRADVVRECGGTRGTWGRRRVMGKAVRVRPPLVETFPFPRCLAYDQAILRCIWRNQLSRDHPFRCYVI